ncbi:MAG: family 16 glycoside hydrolase [Candidatus Aminicenantales bacterium]
MKRFVLFSLLVVFMAGLMPAFSALSEDDLSQVRIKKFPLAMQCWTYRKYTFFETMEKTKALGIKYLQAYPGQPLSAEEQGVTFNHLMTDTQIEMVRQRLSAAGMEVVGYGVADIGRTEEEMRKAFDFCRKMGIRVIATEPQDADFAILNRLVKEYDVRIAVHNHPEPSKYAKPQTVLERIQGLDDRIGACADPGHWMRGGIRPVDALRLLQGRTIDVHIKDRNDFGTGPGVDDVAIGEGKANLPDILAELTLQDYAGWLTIEYENEKEVLTPEPAIRKGLENIKNLTYYWDYTQLLPRSNARYSKHGWNHYGPGYFELDEKEGVLKSQGGMGLFWYSARGFRDFVLELEFKCSQKNTNSGIFIRVPDVPTSDDYICHSFEVQIYDAGEGIHQTAAIYDAEAPNKETSRPTGEWNHLKITCQGRRVRVELNGTQVLDWTMEPRGKVKDFAAEGYIGLQNHDSISPVYFRNIFAKEI